MMSPLKPLFDLGEIAVNRGAGIALGEIVLRNATEESGDEIQEELDKGSMLSKAGSLGIYALTGEGFDDVPDTGDVRELLEALVKGYRNYLSILLLAHKHGDWGELDREDIRTNNRAVRTGERILSCYPFSKLTKLEVTTAPSDSRFWVITEADRSRTTLLLPSEY